MKLTTWNIKHLGSLLERTDTNSLLRKSKVAEQIERIDTDILCLIEAPSNLVQLQNWISSPKNQGGLNAEYEVAVIDGTNDILAQNPSNIRKALQNLYQMKGTDTTGNQWIWFLVKKSLFNSFSAKVQNPIVWQGLTGRKQWPTNYWGNYETKSTSHWRHPQVLLLEINGLTVEVIGVHLKSKINRKRAFSATDKLDPKFVDEALRARVKLATEAYDIRSYIDQRFAQESNPRILVCGDFNDGVGREFFERQYLFFDLVSNIQGNVFYSKRFMNHALFDFEERLRWSTKFSDSVERWARETYGLYNGPQPPFDTTRKQLLDHIFFTQGFVRGTKKPKINPGAGLVEHVIHEKVNAGLKKSLVTSDHRPVSIEIDV